MNLAGKIKNSCTTAGKSTRLGLLGIAGILSVALTLASCGFRPFLPDKSQESQQENPSSQTENEFEAESVPIVAEKTVTVACQSVPKADPVYEEADTAGILSLAFEGLVRAENGEIKPHLAENWRVSEDGLVYTFELNQNARFYDGTPVTPEDWVWSIKRVQQAADAPWQIYAQPIKDVIARDNYLVITLNTVYAPFLSALALPAFSVQSKAQYDMLGDEGYKASPMGTGRFYFESLSHSGSLIATRNRHYPSKPESNVLELDFKIVANGNKRVDMLEDGSADICLDVPVNRIAGLESGEGFSVGRQTSKQRRFINFNTTRAELADSGVRRALRMATDKNEIARVALFGFAQPCYNVFSSDNIYFDREISDEGYDILKAKELLAAAGYPNGFATEISYDADNTVIAGVVTALKSQWAKIGVDLTLAPLPPEELAVQIAELGHSIAILRWQDEINDPAMLSSFILSESGDGFSTGYKNQRLSQLNNDAIITVSAEKRRQAYYEIQEKLYEDCPLFPIYQNLNATAHANYISGLGQTSYGVYDWGKIMKN